jgi:hypothetical protein
MYSRTLATGKRFSSTRCSTESRKRFAGPVWRLGLQPGQQPAISVGASSEVVTLRDLPPLRTSRPKAPLRCEMVTMDDSLNPSSKV